MTGWALPSARHRAVTGPGRTCAPAWRSTAYGFQIANQIPIQPASANEFRRIPAKDLKRCPLDATSDIATTTDKTRKLPNTSVL